MAKADGLVARPRIASGRAIDDPDAGFSSGDSVRGRPIRVALQGQRMPDPHASLRYRDILEQRQLSAAGRRKGERTRDRLKLAAIDLLDEIGYRDMRISDICERADVSTATFYLYYQNKTEITVEVLREFMDTIFGVAETDGPYRSSFDAIYSANLGWIRTVKANAGLLRCLLQVGDQTPEFAEVSQTINFKWYGRVASSIHRSLSDERGRGADLSLVLAYALGSMMDELCRRLFVAQDQHLVDLIAKVAPTDEDLAELIGVIWFRTVYCADPPGVKTKPAAQLLLLKQLRPALPKKSAR